jgi:exo-beta-1,3-glucanase (GH17 family)
MLNWMLEHGGVEQGINSPVGNEGAAYLVGKITDTRTAVAALNLGKTIPIGNSDAGAFFNTQVLSAIDYGMSNVHPWFANVTAAAGAQWTFDFFRDNNLAEAAAVPNRPHMYIAETGWPTGSKDVGNSNNGASPADLTGLQTFLDTFTCQANSGGTDYFFFSVFDEPWKDAQFGGVEGHWGLLNFK